MKIGIIGAMDEEIAIIRALMSPRKDVELGGNTFYSGLIEDIDIVLLKCGIGKVNAAIGATLLTVYHNPNCIINTGSAGGFSDDLCIGDVVISNEVAHHDVDVTAFGYEYGQVPKMPSRYLPNTSLIEMAKQSIEKLDGIRFSIGLVATGDSFMSDPERIDKLKKQMPQIKVAEMEAAAIAQTCYQFNKKFIIFRSVSDIAGQESPHTFKEFLGTAAKNSASIVIEMLKALKIYEAENEARSPESIKSRILKDQNFKKSIESYYKSR